MSLGFRTQVLPMYVSANFRSPSRQNHCIRAIPLTMAVRPVLGPPASESESIWTSKFWAGRLFLLRHDCRSPLRTLPAFGEPKPGASSPQKVSCYRKIRRSTFTSGVLLPISQCPSQEYWMSPSTLLDGDSASDDDVRNKVAHSSHLLCPTHHVQSNNHSTTVPTVAPRRGLPG